MALGPGKYDSLVTPIRLETDAAAVILIVIDGKQGSGFSVQSTSPRITKRLPALLRVMADQIEADTR